MLQLTYAALVNTQDTHRQTAPSSHRKISGICKPYLAWLLTNILEKIHCENSSHEISCDLKI